jgi:hypothetical protein
MKALPLLFAGAFLAAAPLLWLSGCGKEEAPAPQQDQQEERTRQPVDGPASPLSPLDYPGTLIRAKRHAEETAALAEARKDIKAFWALKERYPASLQELREWRGAELPELPKGLAYSYNPETGELEVVMEEKPGR